MEPFPKDLLPKGIQSRFIENTNGLRVHILENEDYSIHHPLLIFLHGFPEVSYSWRRLILPVAQAGFHVVCPDLRGFGRTTGGDTRYENADLSQYSSLNAVRDMIMLMQRLGYKEVYAIIGHDMGSYVAGNCALMRPDIFKRLVLMSGPFPGAPEMFLRDQNGVNPVDLAEQINTDLGKLPIPRKHYQWYYAQSYAAQEMDHPPQGLHDFMRAYFHYKSADWPGNKPFRLAGKSATEYAKMPTYYIMDLDKTMPESVANYMPSPETIEKCQWLPENELKVYTEEYSRTGFQGGLQWYRRMYSHKLTDEMNLFVGYKVVVPSMYIAGAQDWGIYKSAGAFEKMKDSVCTNMVSVKLLEGAGHWVQQEQYEKTTSLLLEFLSSTKL